MHVVVGQRRGHRLHDRVLALAGLELGQLLDDVVGMLLASLGLAGTPELPSAVWQAAQAAVEFVPPTAVSGLAGGRRAAAGAEAAVRRRSSAAVADQQGAAKRAAVSSKANDFMSGYGSSGAKPAILQWRTPVIPATPQSLLMTAPAGPPAGTKTAAALAVGWMHTARFLTTRAAARDLPALELPEIAFVGRSNAGKSTAHQHADAAKAPGLRLEDAGPHAAHQPVRARQARRRPTPVRRPARLRLRGGAQAGQAALAAGDGRLPRDAREPARRGADVRPAPGLTDLDDILLEVIRPRVEQGLKLLLLLTKADKLNRSRAGQGAVHCATAGRRRRGETVLGAEEAGRRGSRRCLLWQWAHPATHLADMIETFQHDLPARHHPQLPRERASAAGRCWCSCTAFPRRRSSGTSCSSISRMPEHGGYRCVAPNLRGYERSSQPADVEAYRAKHLVQDIAALIDSVGGAARMPGRARLGRRGRLGPGQPAARSRCGAWSSSIRRTRAHSCASCKRQPDAAGGERLHELPVPPGRRGAAARKRLPAAVRFFTELGRRALADRSGEAAVPRGLGRGPAGGCNYYRASPLRPPTAGKPRRGCASTCRARCSPWTCRRSCCGRWTTPRCRRR